MKEIIYSTQHKVAACEPDESLFVDRAKAQIESKDKGHLCRGGRVPTLDAYNTVLYTPSGRARGLVTPQCSSTRSPSDPEDPWSDTRRWLVHDEGSTRVPRSWDKVARIRPVIHAFWIRISESRHALGCEIPRVMQI